MSLELLEETKWVVVLVDFGPEEIDLDTIEPQVIVQTVKDQYE